MIKREFSYLGWYLLLCIPLIIAYIKFSSKARREWLALVGKVKPEVISERQKRGEIRLESAFPVEFQKVGEPKEGEYDIHQGFTKDISKGGLSIEALTVRGKKLEDLIPNETKLRLIINIPLEGQAIVTLATVKWVKKVEDATVDRYSVGVSYDDIRDPDLEKITKYALWFRRKPDLLAIMIIIVLMFVAAFFITTVIFKDTKSELERRIKSAEEEGLRHIRDKERTLLEKEEIAKDLEALSRDYAMLLERLKNMETRSWYQSKRPIEKEAAEESLEIPLLEEAPISEEEAAPEIEGVGIEEGAEEMLEPVIELRRPATTKDEIVVEPNITKRMIESEKEVYKTFRDYILKEEIQLLDRYSSQHRASIYHAAGLFALAELRYKKGHITEMIINAYKDVIRLYPNSKYASYASHRLDQVTRNLPYSSYNLRRFYIEYNLPPLFDYRELEPYKE